MRRRVYDKMITRLTKFAKLLPIPTYTEFAGLDEDFLNPKYKFTQTLLFQMKIRLGVASYYNR